MYITYSSGDEIVVTTLENEAATIKLYFTEGGRDIDSYSRREHNDCGISITPRLRID